MAKLKGFLGPYWLAYSAKTDAINAVLKVQRDENAEMNRKDYRRLAELSGLSEIDALAILEDRVVTEKTAKQLLAWLGEENG